MGEILEQNPKSNKKILEKPPTASDSPGSILKAISQGPDVVQENNANHSVSSVASLRENRQKHKYNPDPEYTIDDTLDQAIDSIIKFRDWRRENPNTRVNTVKFLDPLIQRGIITQENFLQLSPSELDLFVKDIIRGRLRNDPTFKQSWSSIEDGALFDTWYKIHLQSTGETSRQSETQPSSPSHFLPDVGLDDDRGWGEFNEAMVGDPAGQHPVTSSKPTPTEQSGRTDQRPLPLTPPQQEEIEKEIPNIPLVARPLVLDAMLSQFIQMQSKADKGQGPMSRLEFQDGALAILVQYGIVKDVQEGKRAAPNNLLQRALQKRLGNSGVGFPHETSQNEDFNSRLFKGFARLQDVLNNAERIGVVYITLRPQKVNTLNATWEKTLRAFEIKKDENKKGGSVFAMNELLRAILIRKALATRAYDRVQTLAQLSQDQVREEFEREYQEQIRTYRDKKNNKRPMPSPIADVFDAAFKKVEKHENPAAEIKVGEVGEKKNRREVGKKGIKKGAEQGDKEIKYTTPQDVLQYLTPIIDKAITEDQHKKMRAMLSSLTPKLTSDDVNILMNYFPKSGETLTEDSFNLFWEKFHEVVSGKQQEEKREKLKEKQRRNRAKPVDE